jgi:hypothetical protein
LGFVAFSFLVKFYGNFPSRMVSVPYETHLSVLNGELAHSLYILKQASVSKDLLMSQTVKTGGTKLARPTVYYMTWVAQVSLIRICLDTV